MGLPGIWYMVARPGRSLLMYMAHWICRKSQFSIRLTMGSPFSRACNQDEWKGRDKMLST